MLAPGLASVLLWALLPCIWRIHLQKRAGTLWRLFHIDGDFDQGHGSGNVDRQCNSSDVSSGAITGSSPSFGRYCMAAVALLLLHCVGLGGLMC